MRALLLLIFPVAMIYSCAERNNMAGDEMEEQIVVVPALRIKTLFVQWQYPSEIEFFKAMDIRHELEIKIDSALRLAKLGEWIAGDMGPGGANMEFGIKSDPYTAIRIILHILRKKGLEKETVIATDIAFSGGKWSYKILYPKKY